MGVISYFASLFYAFSLALPWWLRKYMRAFYSPLIGKAFVLLTCIARDRIHPSVSIGQRHGLAYCASIASDIRISFTYAADLIKEVCIEIVCHGATYSLGWTIKYEISEITAGIYPPIDT